MTLILSIANGSHDASASLHDGYDTLAAVQLERMTRIKGDGKRLPIESIDEVLEIASKTRRDVDVICLMRGHMPAAYFKSAGRLRTLKKQVLGNLSSSMGREKTISVQQELKRAGSSDASGLFQRELFLSDLGFSPETEVFFFNHHLAHALPPLFHNPDWADALIYTADGGGDWVTQSYRFFSNGELHTIFGGDEEIDAAPIVDSVALAYGAATVALGWKINRHEGKLTGLAATGNPSLFSVLREKFTVTDEGRIFSSFSSNGEMSKFIFDLAKAARREDVAASVQSLAESVTLESIGQLLKHYPSKNLGLSGGLFANVLLNQKLLDKLPVDNIFIYPAMSDAGLCTGGALAWLLERDGMEKWLMQRHELTNVYLGRDYSTEIDTAMTATDDIHKFSGNSIENAVAKIIAGKVVSIYTGRQEFGPRALGARSVLASPIDATINQTLNERMERSEFMPFAPYVLEEDADRVFELPEGARYAARFMTITCQVRDEWIEKIPAVVHVDNTARPQIIGRKSNPLYYDVLAGFKKATGLPVLINTSFNVHEEPIINTPNECIKALRDDRVDYVVTENALYCLKTRANNESSGLSL